MDEDGCGCGCLPLAYLWLVGIAIAAVLSWSVNHSVGWLILQAAGSWIYVAYYIWQHGWS